MALYPIINPPNGTRAMLPISSCVDSWDANSGRNLALPTRNYFDATEEWINDFVTDPVMKTRYEVATLAELQRNVGSINPRVFADQNLGLT